MHCRSVARSQRHQHPVDLHSKVALANTIWPPSPGCKTLVIPAGTSLANLESLSSPQISTSLGPTLMRWCDPRHWIRGGRGMLLLCRGQICPHFRDLRAQKRLSLELVWFPCDKHIPCFGQSMALRRRQAAALVNPLMTSLGFFEIVGRQCGTPSHFPSLSSVYGIARSCMSTCSFAVYMWCCGCGRRACGPFGTVSLDSHAVVLPLVHIDATISTRMRNVLSI